MRIRKSIYSNKKGMELSINFIVGLILALAAFFLGLMFIPKLFSAAKDVNEQLDQNSEEILRNMAMEGKVAIYPETIETKVGGGRVIGLGIMNVGQTQNFTVGIKYVSGKDKNGNALSININNWVFVEPTCAEWCAYKTTTNTFEVKRNDRIIESVAFRAPNGITKGTYVFAILVKKDANNDGFNYNDALDENYAGSKLVTITVI